jgi:hypothetical protein
MALLIYIDAEKTIALASISAVPLALREVDRWPAHNEVARSARGDWPPGVYRFSHYNAHAEAGLLPAAANTAYGGTGIYVFDVPGRTGMGVHAGRSINYDKPGGKTLGCIRVSTVAMLRINAQHQSDPITHIFIANRRSLEAVKALREISGTDRA